MANNLNDRNLETLRQQLRTEMNEKADLIAGGGCPSWDSYTKQCGVIAGLAFAEGLLFKMDDDLIKE